MLSVFQKNKKWSEKKSVKDVRLNALFFIIFGILCIVAVRFGILMIWSHSFYEQLANGFQEVSAQLFPTRGNVYIQDSRTKEEFPIAMNRDVFLVYVNPKEIKEYSVRKKTDVEELTLNMTKYLSEVFGFNEEEQSSLQAKLQKYNDPYEPLKKQVEEKIIEEIRQRDYPGVYFLRQSIRYYPEENLGAHIVGFVGKDETGEDIGRYGIEGYWQEELAGVSGFFEGIKSAKGSWIPLGGKKLEESKDGVDLLLTIDRTLEFSACGILKKAVDLYEAEDGSVVIMDPYTGAIRAMCSFPDFDPNNYGQVTEGGVYNNKSIFTAYEPGSIFKPITMAASLNEKVITPQSVFYDSGEREVGCLHPIRNAENKIYKDQSMSGLLENSVNTGMVWVAEQIGKNTFRQYIEDFGFGVKEGIELDTESSGTIDTLYKQESDNMDCYASTAAFGQGITVTPLQVVTAFSAIANGGTLMKPQIIEEIRYSDGVVESVEPKEVRRVISKHTADMVSAMMVNVVDKGHAALAAVPGYYIAGKTGTAQIAERGIYIEETNHSFVGIIPADNPRFVMMVKLGKPKNGKYSSGTSSAVFGDIAQFILQYYGIPPSRAI
ncbi:penicillin-binding protein 2 [Patescibacteria group bacterium]|nr:penicillin-binding protein 2 [Patescibacteria group bacterium]MBU1722081.1 penicillin-binding protein 2 [Patescibacteria group bacterium]MBU1901361.1 penicillin-binding protein 2 [Patescibacteria group bacterium]